MLLLLFFNKNILYYYRTVSKIPRSLIRTNAGFIQEFNSKTELNRLYDDPIEFQMQALWIRERILKKRPGLIPFAEFNLFKHLFIQINPIKRLNVDVHNYLVTNFNKLTKLWLMSLEIQTSHLPPMHTSTLQNIFDFINYLKYVSDKCAAQNAEKYSNIYSQLLKICLSEICRADKELRPLYHEKLFATFMSDKIKCLMGPFLKENFVCFSKIDEINKERTNCSAFDNIDHDEFEKLNTNLDRFYRMLVYIIDAAFESYIQRTPEFTDLLRKLTIVNIKQVTINTLKMLSMVTRPRSFAEDLSLTDKFHNTPSSLKLTLIKYMLEAGCDADSLIDEYSSRSTFLNEGLFRFESTGIEQKNKFDILVSLFLKHGAHLDNSNENSLTVMDLYHSKFDQPLTNIIRTMEFTSLKCLAAHRIIQSDISFEGGLLPAEMVSFVKRHM